MKNIIGWLQLSDLHFPKVKDYTSLSIETRILNAAGDHRFAEERVDFVVITGDYRNIWEKSDDPFDVASSFIVRLMNKLKLDVDNDLFIIPGNHDVDREDECGNHFEFEKREQAIETLSLAEEGDKEDEEAKKKNRNPEYKSYLKSLQNVSDDLKKLFSKYAEFANKLYTRRGKSGSGPEEISISVWKDSNGNPKLRLIRLNTAMASNKERDHMQVCDFVRLGELANEDADLETKLPTIVLAHHSFYDLHPSLRHILVERMNQMNCWVWLAGDRHTNNRYDLESEIVRNISTSADDRTWPNIICGKGMSFDGDDWAELELMHYSWDGETVDAKRIVWEEQGKYQKNTIRQFHMYSAITYGLYDYMYSKLCEVSKNHPSFALLSHVERTLFPRAMERFQIIGTSDNSGEVTSVEDLIKSTWNKPERSHILLEGEGGIGKTVMLLTLATDPKSLAKDFPAIYVPAFSLNLNEESPIDAYIDKYVGSDSKNYYVNQIHLQMQLKWENGPSLLLLLDGFNEITAEKQMIVSNHLKEWLSRNEGVQLVATSRDSLKASLMQIGNIHDVKLLPLRTSSVKAFLKKNKVNYPKNKDLASLIKNPLMLMLYSGTKKVVVEDDDCEIKKNSLNPGKLIWNYVQLEEHSVRQRCKSSLSLYYATFILCELIIPYIAYEMKQSSKFQLEQEDFDVLFNQAYSFYEMDYENDELTARVKQFCSKYCCGIVGKNTMHEGLNRLCILKKMEVTNGSEKELRYQFVHQCFRDYFASVYLITQIDGFQREKSALSEILWGREMDCVTLSFQADLLRWREIKTLWKSVKRISDIPARVNAQKTGLDNVLRLVRLRNEKEYLELDMSDLDLSDFVMCPYKDENKRPFFPNRRDYLTNTKISLKTMGQIDTSSGLTCIGMSFDGSKCFCASYTNVISCWDLASGRCEWSRELGNSELIIVGITPDGNKCICASKDKKSVQVWSVISREIERELVGIKSITGIAISSDGKKVVFGHASSITVWNLYTGIKEKTFDFTLHSGALEHMCVNSSNKCISISGQEYSRYCNVVVLDLDNGEKLIEDMIRWGSPLGEIDGRIHINQKGNTIYMLDNWGITASIHRGGTITDRRIVTGDFYRFAIDQREKKIVTVNSFGTLQKWDIKSGKLEGEINDGITSCSSLVFFQNEQKCLCKSVEGRVYIINMDSFEHETIFDTCVPYTLSIGVNSEETMITTASNDGTIRKWHANEGICEEIQSVFSEEQKPLVLTPRGDYAFFVSQEGTVKKWDAEGKTGTSWPSGDFPFTFAPGRRVAIDPSGTRLICKEGGMLEIWNIEQGKQEYAFPNNEIRTLCVSENGRRGALAGDEGELFVWDVERKEKNRYNLFQQITGMAIDYYGNIIACAVDLSGDIKVVNAYTGAILTTLKGHRDMINCMCITTDGKRCLSASCDKTVREWDLATGECKNVFEGHEREVTMIQVMEKTKKCVSSSLDGTLRIWDLTTGECCKVIRILEGVSIKNIDFSNALFDSEYTKEVLRQNGAIV